MTAKRNRVRRIYREQDGKCAYCEREMWSPHVDETLPTVLFIKTHLGCYRTPDWEPYNDKYSERCKRSRLATIDHVVPLSKKGRRRVRGNQVLACYSCNMLKASLDVGVFLDAVKEAKKKGANLHYILHQMKVKCWQSRIDSGRLRKRLKQVGVYAYV